MRKEAQTGIEERLKTAIKLKNIWSKRRKEEEEESKTGAETAGEEDEAEGVEEARLALEMEEAETMEQGDFIGEIEEFCTDCARIPCSCLLMYLDLKITKLNEKVKVPWEVERTRNSGRDPTEEGVGEAGHQHQVLLGEADAQHQVGGQPHHPQSGGGGVASINPQTATNEPAPPPVQWGGQAAHQTTKKIEKNYLPDHDMDERDAQEAHLIKKKRKAQTQPATSPHSTAHSPLLLPLQAPL